MDVVDETVGFEEAAGELAEAGRRRPRLQGRG